MMKSSKEREWSQKMTVRVWNSQNDIVEGLSKPEFKKFLLIFAQIRRSFILNYNF